MNRHEWAMALAITALWGLNFSVIRYGVLHVDPLALAALRFALCAAPLLVGLRRPALQARWVLVYGLCFGAGTWGLMTLALHLGLSPGLSAWLLQAHAFVTPLLAWVWLGEAVTPAQRVAMGFTAAGFAVVVAAQPGASSAPALLAVAGAAVSISLANLLVRRARVAAADVLPLLVWSSPVSALVLAAALAWQHGAGLVPLLQAQLGDVGPWLSLGFQAFPVTLLGYALWNRLIVRHGPSTMAPLGLLVPVWALVFAGLWQGQWPRPVEAMGLVLIGLGLVGPLLSARWARRLNLPSRPC
jgi:O-acetylserine/cysteine efflux transporter